MKILFLLPILFFTTPNMNARKKTDAWLSELLHRNASGALLHILNNSDSFQYQLIYTQINRNKHNTPSFKHFYLHVDKTRYFNPASTVKMPVAFLALEKLNKMNKPGVNKCTPMLTDSAYSGQTTVLGDSSSENGLPSIAHYIKKIFLVSDNDAYNRLYEFIGQKTINERLWQMGYTDFRVTRRFVPATEEENRHTNPIRFINAAGETLYVQPAAYSNLEFDFSKRILVGRAHYNRADSLIHAPMDFTTHNNAPLEDLQQILQSVFFPASVPAHQRFDLTENDYRFLYEYMSKLPAESKCPQYDTTEFFDSYTKFFMFKSGKTPIPSNIKVFNKTGWSYGFLTDIAYIVDFKNKVECMLSGTIYVNRDGILNDDAYEYEELGYPFFKEVGNIIYKHELERKRMFVPDLKNFDIKELQTVRNEK
ncbi:serine hydrolase [Agriterribacter sp.]|uniref:serine hydrolase n=1 Tax=Agriterribacter sp. TaxID=2821509 RepID=UPI002C9F1CC2|nr:serine hydrolase [Agriterribacter sp.]HTN05211.1 serine hydrolase [Agriterribacter sp.]